jgi:zinc and cadmium transporter
MSSVWLFSIVSVLLVSIISILGIVLLSTIERAHHREESKLLTSLVALAVGALLGDVVIHLMPEAIREIGWRSGIYFFTGFLIFLIMERLIDWQKNHRRLSDTHIKSVGYVNLFGDTLHNFIDGAVIAGSYLISFPIGLATSLAVVLHEIPHELGDYAVLRSAGFSRSRAILINIFTALFALLGALSVLITRFDASLSTQGLLSFTAGGFIFIALALVRELLGAKKVVSLSRQLIFALLGILAMALILLID